ncbi:MAG: YceI family protein [Phycisphaerales bacterium JB060]
MNISRILTSGGLIALGAAGALAVSTFTSSAPADASAPSASPVSFSTGGLAAGEIDSVHSGVVFRIMHIGAAPFRGMFSDVEGTLVVDPKNPGDTEVDVTINIDSVWTGSNGRDEHLRSADYFNARQFPTSTFKATGGKASGDDSVTVDGELTLLGKTLPVSATITRTGEGQARGNRILGYEATMSFKRSDFGMTTSIDNGGLGDQVDLIIFIETAAE